MRLLLDTHVVLWWLIDSPELSAETKDLLDREPEVYLSAASVWEAGIKQAAGKLTAPADLAERLAGAEFRNLPITAAHAQAAARLPLLHRDPFDRMLVAQARCEKLTILTRDKSIPRYDVATRPV